MSASWTAKVVRGLSYTYGNEGDTAQDTENNDDPATTEENDQGHLPLDAKPSFIDNLSWAVSRANDMVNAACSYRQGNGHEVEVCDYVEHSDEGDVQLGGPRVAMIYMHLSVHFVVPRSDSTHCLGQDRFATDDAKAST